MATSSTVVAFKTALVTALTTAINDSNVQVAYGRPQDLLVTKRELVHVADVDYSANVANIKAGRANYDEDYRVDVVFAAGRPRGQSSDSETRVFALFEYLRDLVAEETGKQGFGVDGVWAVTLEAVDATTAHQGEGPVSVLVATLRVRARIE